MKNHPFRTSLVASLTLSLVAPSFSFAQDVPPPAKEPSLAGCAGLASPVKHQNLAKNIPARIKESNNFCGDPKKHVLAGKVGQHLQKIVKASHKCESALKRTVAPNFSIENLVKKPAQRLLKSCIQVRAYNSYSKKLCQDYAKNRNDTLNMNGIDEEGLKNMNNRDSFQAVKGMHTPLIAAYKTMAEDAKGEATDMDKRLPGMKDGQDTVMNQEVEFIKKVVKFNHEKAKELASAKLKKRRELSGETSGLNDMATLRFKTQREVDEFWTALYSCKDLYKENGYLDKWRDDYNKVVSNELAQMKKEALAHHEFFRDASSQHQMQANEVQKRINRLPTSDPGPNEISEREAKSIPKKALKRFNPEGKSGYTAARTYSDPQGQIYKEYCKPGKLWGKTCYWYKPSAQ